MSRPVQVLLAVCVSAAVLAFTINSGSIWTDEAFSAFIASHRSFASAWSTLAAGDSSDLQMVLYYLWLHGWCNVWGQSELALRTAHLPFIVLYAGTLVWASRRLFGSWLAWLVALLTPLTFTFSGDARPYFDVIALSLACLTCLLVYLDPGRTERERRWLPWVAPGLLLLGAGFHMLMLLLGPPLLALLAVYYLRDRPRFDWRDWRGPAALYVPLGMAMGAYFAWTFGRGTSYDYAKPGLLSLCSVLFRFVGLSGYSPDRRYDIPFRPFLIAMGISVCLFLLGMLALILGQRGAKRRVPFEALLTALLVGVAEVTVLTFAVHQQIEFRHLASLLPLLILLVMAGLAAGRRNYGLFAAVAIGGTWLVGDLRQLSPQYAREDFRSAVQQAIELHNRSGADIAVAADPAAVAYYGLQLRGPAPCYPLKNACQEGFAKVPWAVKAPAEFAVFWNAAQIREWMQQHHRTNTAMALLISRGRHPMIKDSAWWPAVETEGRVFPFHGFYVYLIR